ncbi:uncharacterized protein LOC135689488 isoform X1 [Rhopilema esculentum]|uniref:uncharacterized protein LOC135689488 isoform X1 n=1 Tax=Rhopilema esculentum TaxID=499914 RepID=UPI0031DAD918
MSMAKKTSSRVDKLSNFTKQTEAMQTEAANLTLYRGAAFRLPALQRDRNEDPRDNQPPSKVAHICPRELRAMQASESTLVAKQRRYLLQKSKALLKRKRNVEIVGRCSPLLPSINNSRQQADEKSDLQNSVDVMSFLTRELTEVNDAIENSQISLRKDTLKGLRKVIAGVLHTLRQDQINVSLDLMDLSNKMKYENITQAVPLSPRVLNKAEKREPVQRRPHICKGCKDGGLLPWLYLYPDHEVYRTGGGFDCVEFHLPCVHSEKPLTKPKDPFVKERGKLVDTSMHRLPEKSATQTTKPLPFKLSKPKISLEVRLEIPESDQHPLSPVSKVKFGKRKKDFAPATQTCSAKEEHRGGKDSLYSSTETIVIDKDKELEGNNVSQQSQKTLASSGYDSGFVTAVSSASENQTFEKNDVTNTDRESSRPSNLSDLNHLRKRLTGYEELKSVRSPRQTLEAEAHKGPKKLVVRRSMSITPNTNDIKSIHNSALLPNVDSTSPVANNAFGVRKKQPLKPVGYRKKISSVDGVEKIGKDHTSSISDMSVNFSSSLSIGTSQQDILEDYSDFTLTGSRVVGLKRLAKDHERRKAAKSNNNGRKASKALDDVNHAEEEGRERKRLNQRKASRNESKRKFSKKGSNTKKMGTTEVFVDIFSSMSQEIYNSDSESFEMDSNSRGSSSKALERIDSKFRIVEEEEEEAANVGDQDGIKEESLNNNESIDSYMDFAERSLTDEINELENAEMDIEVDNHFSGALKSNEESEGMDEFDDLAIDSDQRGKKVRKRLKRRKTLQFRNEPLSRYTLKRRQRKETEALQDMEEDLSMLDYAARYCIISLERLSKYENVFSSYAACNGDDNGMHSAGEDQLDAMAFGETDEQRKILKEYERLIYSMDLYQQKISEAEKKKTELKCERDTIIRNMKDSRQLDVEKKKLLEKSLQTLAKKIATVDDRIEQFVDNVKNMMIKKRSMEDRLRELSMDNETVDKLIKNCDFLGRKFAKLKCLKINVEDLPEALKSFNSNFDEEDFLFVNHVLQLPQKDSLDFKAFAVVSALTERVKSLDKSIKALLKEVDLGTLERKLDKCKELYRLLSEEHHDGNRIVPLENLLVELQAGGLDQDHQRSVIDKLNHHGHGFIDFLDFVLYIPLFLMIHDQIVAKPFE